jgi:SAM-dependent methyltransferase
MAANPYDEVPYPTRPQPQTHPDRLAAVGRLFGMRPARVERCRVLEIGCGDGGNLIPMACALPESRFTGVDLAAVPIAAAARAAADLALGNLELHACDLREIDAGWGEFDYILAHGVFSWVPAEVRERLLGVCRDRLSPTGVALVSYNALPGGYVRQMLREMLLHHTRDAAGAPARLAQAREFLRLLARARLLSPPWQALRDHEVKALLARDPGSFYHDELAPRNQRFYFHEFIAAARHHGLQYLGEAEPHEMFDPARLLAGFAGDFVEREQHLDFLKARRFRQTLLCRAETTLRRETSPQQMHEFLFSAPARRLANGQIEGARRVRISPPSEPVREVALALGEVDPLPLAFDELIPYAGSAQLLEEILYSMATAGFADLHVFDFPCQDSVSERPRAARLVRYQAARSPYVTSACHIAVELNEAERRLVALLDGTRTHGELAAALPVKAGRGWLKARMEQMAGRGLLEG